MKSFGAVLTAMITPFTETGAVDYQASAQLARHLVAHGSDGLVICGSTGEGAVMTAEEKLKLFATIREAVGPEIFLVANTGSNNTQQSVAFTKEAEKTGVNACMAVVPYYNKPTQEGCYQHFAAIAQSTSLPIILYNVPGRTASQVTPETIARLANEFSNIVAVKEASGNLNQVSEIARLCPEGFLIYSGDDSLTLPILAVGGCGVISVAGHLVGEQLNQMVTSFLAGDVQKAQQIHYQLLPIMKKLFFISNPIPVKEAVGMIGLPAGEFRLPLVHANEKEKEFIREFLNDYDLC